jgi:CheY-like chemotaxis protein
MLLQERGAARLDILIAEVDARDRQNLRRLLEREGYHCAEAATGGEAVALAQRHPPRCVLLDLQLPELDGLTVARRLRADPRTQGAYIHCLTTRMDEAAGAEAIEAGCDRSLTKPVDVNALLQVVQQELRHPRGWVRGLTKTEAEDLLDWLEAHGAAGELDYEEGRGFAIRCPGFRVEQEVSGRWVFDRPVGSSRSRPGW